MANKHAQAVLKHLEAYCREHALRFTAPRQHVLEIIAASDAPLGAYEILARYGQRYVQPQPPTIYRALAFLEEHGIIHRIESLNAYVLCTHEHSHHGTQFMICDKCHCVREMHMPALSEMIDKHSETAQFEAENWSIEVRGLCGSCRPQSKS